MSVKQRDILNKLSPDFARDGESQAEYISRKHAQILRFISEYTKSAHAAGWVIGISGGIDSFLVGALLAECAKTDGKELIAVMLPNGEQHDISDAVDCTEVLRSIYPGVRICTVNIAEAYDGMVESLDGSGQFVRDAYTTGNIQPRLRMTAQYALAKGLLVAGTDHTSEAITGFYTKYGDGGVDFNPIGQMIKDDIYDLSRSLNAPKAVMDKAPAAGIGISVDDESELGISYADICSYLRGNPIPESGEERIVRMFNASAHKRTTPPTTAWLYTEYKTVTHIHCGGAAAEESVEYINAHPWQEVLYVDTDDERLINGINKTVNTPIKRYNCFSGSDMANPEYGALVDNIHDCVVLTGKRKRVYEAAGALPETTQIRLIQSCISE